jgi:thiol peroxidase
MTLIGPRLKAGDAAPDFECMTCDLASATLASTAGKVRLFSVVCSVDTSVCDQQLRRVCAEADQLPPDTAVIAISCDLPFTQARWCALIEAARLAAYSDCRDASFGRAYGLLIKELRMLARALIVVDRKDAIRYIEVVAEITQLPDFEAAFRVLREAS